MRRILIALVITALLCVLPGACGKGVPEIMATLPPILEQPENQWDNHLDSAPDGGCARMRFPGLGSIGRMFNDSNYLHLRAARELGIHPVGDLRSAWTEGRGLVRIGSCREYYLAPLSHSYPYLVPEAAQLLQEIGARFADSLEARGGGAYRPKVTSVLRTPHTLGRLRRVNRNASDSSAHQFATTFDISYSKFICDDSTATRRTFEDLKNLLACVVRDLRDEGRCYVKHERRQACFHITVRPQSDKE
ncbi:MAG: hypothetical protein K2L96_03565 [Muribaculaceae bacterium]|nr:hypothetical protein [Muribaculaceae bacterium]